MVNTLQERRDSDGRVVAYRLDGRSRGGQFARSSFPLFELELGEYADGASTIIFPHLAGDQTFDFTLPTDPNDPVGKAGKVSYDLMATLLNYTTHAHGAPAPVIDDPLEALRTQIAALVEASVPAVMVFDDVYLREYTRDDGSRHFGFHFFNRDNAEFQFATGDFTYGLVKVSPDVRHLRVRFYNRNGDVVQELRAPVSTNDFTGFDYKMHGLAKTITGAFAYSDFAVADSKAREAAGDAGGDAGGSGGDAT